MNQTYIQHTSIDENISSGLPCLLCSKLYDLEKIIFFKLKYPLILVLLLSSISVNARDSETKGYKNYVGVNAGFTSGLGFTYGFWPGKLGIQFSVLPIKIEDNTLICASITPFYALSKTKYFKGYLFLGNSLVSNKYDTEYNLGFGPGFEAGSRIVFSLRGGIGLYDVTDTFSILPTLDAGIYFKF